MNVQLQKAVAAIRAGKKEEARALLDELVTSDPQDVHVLFLLSTVAHAQDEQIAFVRQVLEIDPGHVGAQKRLAQLQPALSAVQADRSRSPEAAQASTEPELQALPVEQELTLPISANVDDFMAQAEADTIPPWIAGQGGAETTPFGNAGDLGQPDLLAEPQNLPDWLQERPAHEWMGFLGAHQKQPPWITGSPQKNVTVRDEPAEPIMTGNSAPVSAPATNRLLLGLSLLAVIVAALFVYVFIVTFLLN
jgi:hypothetical protein